jgi:CheY-like chemotaxis protein
MLTAKVQAQDRRQFDGLGVKGVVAKPFDPMTLHRDIAEQLGWGEA